MSRKRKSTFSLVENANWREDTRHLSIGDTYDADTKLTWRDDPYAIEVCGRFLPNVADIYVATVSMDQINIAGLKAQEGRPLRPILPENVDNIVMRLCSANPACKRLVLYRRPDGLLDVLGGGHRALAFEELAFYSVEAYILPTDTPAELVQRICIVLNADHGSGTPASLALDIAVDMIANGWSEEDAAKFMMVSRKSLSLALKHNDVRTVLALAGVDAHAIDWLSASAISRLHLILHMPSVVAYLVGAAYINKLNSEHISSIVTAIRGLELDEAMARTVQEVTNFVSDKTSAKMVVDKQSGKTQRLNVRWLSDLRNLNVALRKAQRDHGKKLGLVAKADVAFAKEQLALILDMVRFLLPKTKTANKRAERSNRKNPVPPKPRTGKKGKAKLRNTAGTAPRPAKYGA